VRNKLDNVLELFGPRPWSALGIGDSREHVRTAQRDFIWDALGFLIGGWVLVGVAFPKKREPLVPHAGWLLIAAAANLLIWCVVIFGPYGTMMTHSSFADVLLLMVGLSAFLLLLPPRAAAAIVLLSALNTAANWLSFVPSAPAHPAHPQWALLIFAVSFSLGLLVHLVRSLFEGQDLLFAPRNNSLGGTRHLEQLEPANTAASE
jgi:hypothetical protein